MKRFGGWLAGAACGMLGCSADVAVNRPEATETQDGGEMRCEPWWMVGMLLAGCHSNVAVREPAKIAVLIDNKEVAATSKAGNLFAPDTTRGQTSHKKTVKITNSGQDPLCL